MADKPFIPPVHYLRNDGVECCVHAKPVGPNSCEFCRELADDEEPTVGPRCGNNPNYRLSDGDREVVEKFKAYLARRAAGGPPERDPFGDAS